MEATRPVVPLALWTVAAVPVLALVGFWIGFILPMGLGLGLSWVWVRHFRQPPPVQWMAAAVPAVFHLAAIALLASLFSESGDGPELAYLVGWVASLSLAGLVTVLTCFRARSLEQRERRAACTAAAMALAVWGVGVLLLWNNGDYIRQQGNEALPRIVLPILYLGVLGIAALAAWATTRRLEPTRVTPTVVVALWTVVAVLVATFFFPVEFMNDCTGHTLLPYTLC